MFRGSTSCSKSKLSLLTVLQHTKKCQAAVLCVCVCVCVCESVCECECVCVCVCVHLQWIRVCIR